MIGQRILIALKASGRTQADLARGLKINPTTVKGWVKDGRVPLADVILPICDFLNVSPMWLLSNDDSRIMPKNSYEELTDSEISLLSAYNKKPELQIIVNKILEIGADKPADEYVYVAQASAGLENCDSGVIKMRRSEYEEMEEKLRSAKPVKKL